MPAVETQLLADESDLAALGPLPSALGPLSSEVKLANLRRASGEVLAAYAKRFKRTAGASFTLSAWGDFTKGLVVDIAAYRMISGPRGTKPSGPDGDWWRAKYEEAMKILDAIADVNVSNPRMDPDAVGDPDGDDMGPLASFEGGTYNESDYTITRRSR